MHREQTVNIYQAFLTSCEQLKQNKTYKIHTFVNEYLLLNMYQGI